MYNLKNFPPAADYTPSNVQFVLRASTAHSIIFSNLQAAIALSTHAQNDFYKLVGALRLGYIIFTGGYRALYTKSYMYAQNASTKCDWDAAETLSYLIRGRLRRSLHMHKTLVNRNIL